MPKVWLYLIAFGVAAFGLWRVGDFVYDLGRSSYKAEVEAATAVKNKEIRKGNAEDAVTAERENADELEAVAKFNKNASTLQSFALDAETAAALNAFGD